MKTKILGVILAQSILTAFVPCTADAKIDIQIGEYVQMGTYYGAPILWRCVDIDENGPLMLSDKRLCLKAFDAAGEENTAEGSHSRSADRKVCGSSYWADSNIRSWLNSTASAGNVEWLCGNPPIKGQLYGRYINGHYEYNEYDQEAGFLSNFTQTEKNAIKEVSQKSLLSYPDCHNGMEVTGTAQFYYNEDIADVVQNYDKAFAEYVTDKMFLMDVKQLNAVYNNRNILGERYYYRMSYCWLRTPYYDDGRTLRLLYPDGAVRKGNAPYQDCGVVPAFYLEDSVSFNTGDGTAENPYTVENSFTVLGMNVTNTSDADMTAAY